MTPSGKYPSGNLLAAAKAPDKGEVFEGLLRCRNVHVERIVSGGRPDPVLYDQEQDDWVCLLQGEAELWLAGEPVTLGAGDWVFIPSGTPHRVSRTSADPPCIWLAVHIHPETRVGGAGGNSG